MCIRDRTNGDGLSRLLMLTTEEELVALVIDERSAGRMRVDDSTLIVVAFDITEESDGIPFL